MLCCELLDMGAGCALENGHLGGGMLLMVPADDGLALPAAAADGDATACGDWKPAGVDGAETAPPGGAAAEPR